jgi:hypothetical protein
MFPDEHSELADKPWAERSGPVRPLGYRHPPAANAHRSTLPIPARQLGSDPAISVRETFWAVRALREPLNNSIGRDLILSIQQSRRAADRIWTTAGTAGGYAGILVGDAEVTGAHLL